MAESKVIGLLSQVGIGHDSILVEYRELANLFNSIDLEKYPPYQIKKTSTKSYLLELNLAGFKKNDLTVSQQGNVLTIQGQRDNTPDPEGDDIVLAGNKVVTNIDVKFILSRTVSVDKVEFKNAVLYISFIESYEAKGYREYNVLVDQKVKTKTEYNHRGEPIGLTIFEEKVVEEAEVPAKPVVIAVDKPVIPQIVEVAIVEETDKEVKVELKEALYEVVSDNVITEAVKTPEGKADIVIAVPEEVKAKLDEAGVDVKKNIEAILADQQALAPEVPVVPVVEEIAIPVIDEETEEVKLEVKTPEVIAPVVEVVLEQKEEGQPPTVILVEASEDVAEDAQIVPVVTAAEENDAIVVVPDEVAKKLEEAGIDVAADIGKALQEAEVEVVDVEWVAEPEEVEGATEVVEEGISVVVNAEDAEKATVEVVLPEVLPQVIEVAVTDVADETDVASEEPQISVELNDASYEVVSDNVETVIVKTEEGKADIVIAVPEEVKQSAANVEAIVEDVKAAVEFAIENEAVVVPDAPVASEEVPGTVVVETENVVVETPVIIPSVVEAKIEDDKVVLVDVTADIPAEAVATPIVTAEEQNDAVVVVAPETATKAEELGIDVVAEVEKAVVEANVAVEPIVLPAIEEVVAEEKVEEPVVEEATEESPVDEEVPAEEVVEVVEEVVAEAPAEEVVAEVIEESTVEEPAAEVVEPVAEEIPSVEEAVEVVEEVAPEVSEAPADIEEAAEEVVAEVVEEVPAEVVEEPVAEVVEEATEEVVPEAVEDVSEPVAEEPAPVVEEVAEAIEEPAVAEEAVEAVEEVAEETTPEAIEEATPEVVEAEPVAEEVVAEEAPVEVEEPAAVVEEVTEEAAPEVVEETIEEVVAEETLAEEPVADVMDELVAVGQELDAEAEAAEAEVVEVEVVAEETVEEAPVAEETVAEEAAPEITSEPVHIETPVEEVAVDAAEETVVAEEAVTEEVAEESVAEEITEEAPAEEPASEEPKKEEEKKAEEAEIKVEVSEVLYEDPPGPEGPMVEPEKKSE